MFGPSEEALADGLGRLARGNVTVDHVRGALVGLVGGLLIGCALVGVVGRGLTPIAVACSLVLVGAVFGAVRKSGAGELPAFLLLGAALGGLVAGAAVGALLGAVVGLARD
jgi:hypothetical protein